MFKFILVFSIILSACGNEEFNVPVDSTDTAVPVSEESLGLCSTNAEGTALECSNGQVVALPPAFPYSKDCNECLTTSTVNEDGSLTIKVNCPNPSIGSFSFIVPKGMKGDRGDIGPVGPQGPKGDPGQSCTLGTNKYGQTTITCGTETTVINGCGGGGCWSFGLKGNVFDLPVNTGSLPDFSTMTPVATHKIDDLSVFNRQSSLGFPGTFTPAFTKKEWYGIQYSGFVQLPECKDEICIFRLTSDDGAILRLGDNEEIVVDNDGLHSPKSKTGSVWALPGWHYFVIDYFQGPKTQISLAIEVSEDGGITYKLVKPEEFKHLSN